MVMEAKYLPEKVIIHPNHHLTGDWIPRDTTDSYEIKGTVVKPTHQHSDKTKPSKLLEALERISIKKKKSSNQIESVILPSLKTNEFPLKINGWRCIPYWNSHFLGDMLVFGGVITRILFNF